mmetsp:Transcript_2665/g.9731  ORF Transcript_2665/g.9731 Transcript_2665/m.9731 type:complete len:310 (-) Transcript_2665:144-1073(-)
MAGAGADAALHAVLDAAKHGRWPALHAALPALVAAGGPGGADRIPAPRRFGLVHQLAFHGRVEALAVCREAGLRLDLGLRTRGAPRKTAADVAAENGNAEFVAALEAAAAEALEAAVRLAKEGTDWARLRDEALPALRAAAGRAGANRIPPGRRFGLVHQLAFHGHVDALAWCQAAGLRLDLDLRTRGAPQQPRRTAAEVARENGHADAAFLFSNAHFYHAGPAAATPNPLGIGGATPPADEVSPEEEAAADEADRCCVCMVRRKDTVLLPCKHLCLCSPCHGQMTGAGLYRCPLCNTDIGSAIGGIFF